MKLAFLTATFPCSTETFVFREWEYLQRDKDLDIQVFSIRKPRGYSRVELPEGVECNVQYLRPDNLWGIFLSCVLFPLRRPAKSLKCFQLLLKELWKHPMRKGPALTFQMLAGIYLGSKLKRQNYDVIHGHFSSASSIALFAGLASGIPFSYTIYANDDLFTAPVDFFEAKIKHCKAVVTDTEYNRRMINLLTDFRYEEKVEVIYTGLDLKQFENVKPKSSFSSPLRLLSVGSMSGFKGYPTILKALSLVREKGIAFEYHIVGGGDAEIIERLIERYDLTESVKVLGARTFKNVRKEFEWCDIFIMASEINAGGRRDGFPTVIAEAMLLQRLVISTYISDIPNNVIDRETGLICAEKSPEQLAGSIMYAEQAPDECHAMVDEAHKMAVAKFDANTNYKHLADIFTSMTGM